jgi:hypothetical protein
MLTIVFVFFRAPLADFSFRLERDQPASVLRDPISIGTVIRTTIACL